MVYGWPDLSAHPIIGMVDAGLKCMLNSDDPTMFHTDIGKEYVDMVPAAGWGLATVRELDAQRGRGHVARRRPTRRRWPPSSRPSSTASPPSSQPGALPA